MFVNEYTLKKLFEERNDQLEKEVIENLLRNEKKKSFFNPKNNK
ncbi:hypothetical protein [Metabacillus bambusae]|nr:hypothetical protein [Metabacillus bambusae]